MSELSIAPVTAVILGLALAVDAYNKTSLDPTNQDTNQKLFIVIVSLSVFLLVALVAVLFRPSSAGVRMLLRAVGIIALVVALVVSWINYVNNYATKFSVETLLIALAVSVPILISIYERETIDIRLRL
jgi:predicted neutral ceramidase superfamily lipid hydrolase